MKRILLVLAGITLFPNLCAYSAPLNVAYDAKVPAAVRAQMPRYGQSIFYGVTGLWHEGRKVAVHFYRYFSNKVTYHPRYNSVPPGIIMRYAVDIFSIRFPEGRNAKRKFEKLTTSASWQSDLSFNLVKITQLWLDTQTHKIPILKLDCRVADGFWGAYGSYTLLTFNRGLKSKPVVSAYEYGGNSTLDLNATFDKVDERGYLVVTDSYIVHVQESESTITDLYWNGSGFAGRKETPQEQDAAETDQVTGTPEQGK